MNKKLFSRGISWLAATLVIVNAATGAPLTPLTPDGQKLLAKYSMMLTNLRQEISQALPHIAPSQEADFLKVFAAEGQAGKYSDQNPAFVKAAAKTVEAAQPVLKDTEPFLNSDGLDDVLVKATVIAQATPHSLAAFALQSSEHAALINKLLADPALMKRMLIAGGAIEGRYGQAMQIYTDILKASSRAHDGCLNRLALALAVQQVSARGFSHDNGVTVSFDPVRRYLDYQKAYLKGWLDPKFPTLSAWEYRMVVDSPFSNQEIDWCRQMLRNYRPDLMKIDYRWRYTEISPDEVKYTHINWNLVPGTRAEKIIASGGVCGPRAWFGRLADRAFGIPVWGLQQPGHAAWTHWTPDGWIICQGGSWDIIHWFSQPGPDFLLESQARQFPKDYLKVLRAQWLGDTFGQRRYSGNHPGVGGFWPALALMEERVIVAEKHPKVAKRIGPDSFWGPVTIPGADKHITVAADGKIIIPAVACSSPTNNTRKIRFMESDLGGMQLHYNRLGKRQEPFSYHFEVAKAGKYVLTARVVTVNPFQKLQLTANNAPTPADVAVPYTAGMWGKSQPVEITLVKGQNTLLFTRAGKDVRGVTIKDFTLTPVR